jgi:signal transduction histidine kinase
MIDKQQVISIAEKWLNTKEGYFLVDVDVTLDNRIVVEIDQADGVWIDDCVDLSRFIEVVKHLLSNATKFTDRGTVTIGFDAPHEGRISIWVSDTGKGIAKEHLDQIFERFFKVDEFIPGAGLGLSICHTMAYSMGGTVTVQSQLGEGSTFKFELPVS